MASGKEIRTKIASVKSTQKITKAMEMVAASKLRRTQQRMAASRPYAEKIKTVIGHLSQANPDYRHPYLQKRDIKRVGYIVISTDRGLAGGVNTAMTDAYREGKIDRLFLVHSVYVNTMSQQPTVSQLLPVEPVDKDSLQQHWDYIYE